MLVVGQGGMKHNQWAFTIHSTLGRNSAVHFQELVVALGYDSCVLVAHDWGGAVAQRFINRNPEMVKRLILCNIPHSK